MTNQPGHRYPKPETNGAQTAYNVYLEQGSNQSWYALIRRNPPSEDAVMLCTESDYPVEVSYRRADINGSISYDTYICCDREDLLQALDWLGDCGFIPCQVWDFDIDNELDPALHKLFNDAYSHRLQKIQNAADEIYADSEELSYDEGLSISDSEMQEMLSRASERLEGDAKAAFHALNEQIKLASSRATEASSDVKSKESHKDDNRFPF